jgi:hypothetical protein
MTLAKLFLAIKQLARRPFQLSRRFAHLAEVNIRPGGSLAPMNVPGTAVAA